MGASLIKQLYKLTKAEAAELEKKDGRPSIATLRKVVGMTNKLRDDLNRAFYYQADRTAQIYDKLFKAKKYKFGNLLPEVIPDWKKPGWEGERDKWENSADKAEKKAYKELDEKFLELLGTKPDDPTRAKCTIWWAVNYSTDEKFGYALEVKEGRDPLEAIVWLDIPGRLRSDTEKKPAQKSRKGAKKGSKK